MTDRSTTVTIGAVLASNFRSTFRDARREVDALSGTLDRLSAPRNNAGLRTIRDAAAGTATAVRGLRAELASAGRAAGEMNRRADRVRADVTGLGSAARMAARDLGTMSRAMGSLGNASGGAAGLRGIEAGADHAARELRGLRTETATVGRALRALDGHLTRATTALGRFTGETRAATAATHALSSIMGAAASGLQGAAGHIGATTSALHSMTAATNAQTAAQARMNRAGWGGGRGPGGGGHGGAGGHMPMGAHAGIHAAFGAVGGAALGGEVIRDMWREGAGLAHERVMRQMQGWSDDEIREAEAQAMRVSRAIGSVSKREGLKIMGEMGFVLGNRREAVDVLPMAARATALLQSVNPEIDGAKNAYNMVRALELMNKANHKDIGPWMEAMTGAMFASGGKVTGRDFQQFAAQSGAGAQYYTKDFLTQVAPTAIQELGGQKAGTAMNTMRRALVGGKMTKDALESLAELGLLDPTKTDYAQGGLSRSGRGWIRNQHHHGSPGGYTQPTISVRKGAVTKGDLLQRDPYQWVQTVLKPMLVEHKITDQAKVGETLTHLFSDRNSERIASIMLLQATRTEKDRTQILEALQSATMSRLRNDPTYALQTLKTQWENLLGSSGQAFNERFGLGRGMSAIADGLGAIASMSPGALSGLTAIGASAVTVPASLWAIGGAARLTGGAFRTMGVGLGRVLGLFRSPYFLAFAAAGYLISKNWDRVGPVVEATLSGIDKGFSRIGSALATVDRFATGVLSFFGLAGDGAKGLGDAAARSSGGLERFSDVVGKVVFTLSGVVAARMLWSVATGFRAIGAAIGVANMAAAGGGLMSMLRFVGGPAGAAMLALAGFATAKGMGTGGTQQKRGWVDSVDPGLGNLWYGRHPGERSADRTWTERFGDWWRGASGDAGRGPRPAGDGGAPVRRRPRTTPIAGARALGGPVTAGRPYLVGERGPEIFVPNGSGSIETNNALRQINAEAADNDNAPGPTRRTPMGASLGADGALGAGRTPRPMTLAGGAPTAAVGPSDTMPPIPAVGSPAVAPAVAMNAAAPVTVAQFMLRRELKAAQAEVERAALAQGAGSIGAHGWDEVAAKARARVGEIKVKLAGQIARDNAPAPAVLDAAPRATEEGPAPVRSRRRGLASSADNLPDLGDQSLAERMLGIMPLSKARRERQKADPSAVPNLGAQTWMEWLFGTAPRGAEDDHRTAPDRMAEQGRGEAVLKRSVTEGVREGLKGLDFRGPDGSSLAGFLHRTSFGGDAGGGGGGAGGEGGGSPARAFLDQGADKPSETVGGGSGFKTPHGGGRFNGFGGRGDAPGGSVPSTGKRGPRKGGASGGDASGPRVVPSSLEMPKGGDGVADPTSLKGVLFKGESGGNPGIYNYRVGKKYHVGHLDADNTTVAELMRKQAAGQVFAAGKYQIIPQTMKGAAKALGLNGSEKFDSKTQDRIYTDYLAGSKRPQISNYITGKNDNLRGANIAMAEEWASVGDPSRGGRGHYDGDGVNHASISVAKAQAALQKARAEYQRLTAEGVDPETARRSALLGIRDPKSGAPGGAVAGRDMGSALKAAKAPGAVGIGDSGATAARNAAASGDAAKASIEHAASAKAAVQAAVEAKQQVASAGGKGDWNYTKGDTIHNYNLPHGAAQNPRQYASAVAGHQGRNMDNEAAELRSATLDWVA